MTVLDAVCHLDQEQLAVTGIPVSVIVPVRNEAKNLPRCLESLRGFAEVYVIDSGSSDASAEIGRSKGAKVVQFRYSGGWPKKRQWAMDYLPLMFDWVLLVDADEVLTPELMDEISKSIESPLHNGYRVNLQMHFLGRRLRYSDAGFYKLSLFRRSKGRYECRLEQQDTSMCDMEVHEHVIVEGSTGTLKNPLIHHNVESLSRYIQKHDEYSNWESHVWLRGDSSRQQLPASLMGTQAQRRRWLKKTFLDVPGSPFMLFFYKYVLKLGFLDGIPGLIFCAFQGVQVFHTKAKIYELGLNKG